MRSLDATPIQAKKRLEKMTPILKERWNKTRSLYNNGEISSFEMDVIKSRILGALNRINNEGDEL